MCSSEKILPMRFLTGRIPCFMGIRFDPVGFYRKIQSVMDPSFSTIQALSAISARGWSE